MLTVPEYWQAELRKLASELNAAIQEHDAGATDNEDVWSKYDDMEFAAMRSLFYSALAARKFKESGRVENAPIWSRPYYVKTRSYQKNGSLPFGDDHDREVTSTFYKVCHEIIHSSFTEFLHRGRSEDWPSDEPQICGIIVASDHHFKTRALEVRFDQFLRFVNELAATPLEPPKVKY